MPESDGTEHTNGDTPVPDETDNSDKPCERCDRVIGDHTVREWRQCLSDLYEYEMPFEDIAGGKPVDQEMEMILAGNITVRSAVHRSPVGVFPVLVFDFGTAKGPVAPIGLILDTNHMRSVRHIVGNAIDSAVKAARRAR